MGWVRPACLDRRRRVLCGVPRRALCMPRECSHRRRRPPAALRTMPRTQTAACVYGCSVLCGVPRRSPCFWAFGRVAVAVCRSFWLGGVPCCRSFWLWVPCGLLFSWSSATLPPWGGRGGLWLWFLLCGFGLFAFRGAVPVVVAWVGVPLPAPWGWWCGTAGAAPAPSGGCFWRFCFTDVSRETSLIFRMLKYVKNLAMSKKVRIFAL